MSENIRVMIPEEELTRRIKELGEAISKDFEGEEVYLVCVLKGAAFFATELAKRITVPVVVDFMATSSYGSGTVSSGVVKITKELDFDPKGRNVVVAEDIIDSGNTLNFLLDYFKDKGAKSITLCTMLDKPDRREVDVKVDYTGFTIPDEFVVGYGLDYDQRYRNLPYIGVVENV
ncbi:MAG: hypoxanthine phosphoribosyltransferase [Lachnospiraceae bacterium]|jgi:hypoxanthine phosphoribosyltransferase|nr:hypoxanthine phosphoribosyltransferase [Lachnospiraceae bacterium]SEI87179.1 hypoxanthine phosphoribosyltransferase [Lachnospiraceae bacterium A10]